MRSVGEIRLNRAAQKAKHYLHSVSFWAFGQRSCWASLLEVSSQKSWRTESAAMPSACIRNARTANSKAIEHLVLSNKPVWCHDAGSRPNGCSRWLPGSGAPDAAWCWCWMFPGSYFSSSLPGFDPKKKKKDVSLNWAWPEKTCLMVIRHNSFD